MALRRRRIDDFLKILCLVASRGLEIRVSSTSFQKSNIGWPQHTYLPSLKYGTYYAGTKQNSGGEVISFKNDVRQQGEGGGS